MQVEELEGEAIITDQEADILRHTSNTGRYVTGEARVIEMAQRGLLYDYGPQALAGGMHYLTTTMAGRQALNEWGAAQPKPKQKRGMSVQFRSWRAYCDACARIGFSEFLKTVWPYRHEHQP